MHNHTLAPSSRRALGFTLIEVSLVLIISGFLIGLVLIGKTLLSGAEMRAMISQKEKYDAAIVAFELKYDAMPGDIPPEKAAMNGLFTFTAPVAGQTVYMPYLQSTIRDAYGNGDGNVDGVFDCSGENIAFWRHLSDAGLIEGSYGGTAEKSLINPSTGAPIGPDPMSPALFHPVSKAGDGFVRFTMHGYFNVSNYMIITYKNAYLYTGISNISNIGGCDTTSATLYSPIEAYALDSKIDDGMPNTGKVTSDMLNYNDDPLPGVCTYNQTAPGYWFTAEVQYNKSAETGGNEKVCNLVISYD